MLDKSLKQIKANLLINFSFNYLQNAHKRLSIKSYSKF